MFVSIGFCSGKGNSLITRSIQLFDRTKSSHAYVHLRCGNVFHAHEENQNVMTPSEIKEHYSINEVFLIPVSGSKYKRIEAFCHGRVETLYSKRSVVGAGINRLTGLPNFLWEDGKQNCAEHIGRVLNILGAKIPEQDFKIIGIKRIHDELMKMQSNSLAVRKVYNVA